MGQLRVIGGALRGRKISVPDRGVRPTADRVREAIFDILGPAGVAGAAVLDLYAGSGALGIEALSRGAVSALFLEGDAGVARTLRRNLETLDLAARARVRVAGLDPSRGADPLAGEGPFDLVFLDPPYATGAGEAWLARLAALEWPGGGGRVIYERRSGPAGTAPDGLTLAKERVYGETTVSIYRAGGPEAAPGRGGP
jgi:16S rRNA (guanine966-N2)-methyltransferase